MKKFYAAYDEQDLIRRAQQGDNQAFDLLLGHYRRNLVYYLSFLMADQDAVEDIIQVAYLRVYKCISQFQGIGSFKSWLFTIVRNTWKNYLRNENFERFDRSVDVYTQEMVFEESVEKQIIRHQRKHNLQEAMNCLPSKQCRTVRMRINEELSFDEIAHNMSCSVSTAKTNHYSGIKSIQQMLVA